MGKIINLVEPMSHKFNTADDVRIALGLEDWGVFAQKVQASIRKNDWDEKTKSESISNNRTTGRTTKMLVDAVYKSQFHKIKIHSHKLSFTRTLTSKAISMCNDLGIDSKNIIHPESKEKFDIAFTDHYIGG